VGLTPASGKRRKRGKKWGLLRPRGRDGPAHGTALDSPARTRGGKDPPGGPIHAVRRNLIPAAQGCIDILPLVALKRMEEKDPEKRPPIYAEETELVEYYRPV